jgi:hypothetical protein
MTLSCKLLIGVLLVILLNGSNSASVQRDMLANSVSLVLQDIVTALLMVDRSCLASLATVTSMLKFVTPKPADAFVSTILAETTAINARAVFTATLWLELHTIVQDVHVLKTELACSYPMKQSSALSVPSDILDHGAKSVPTDTSETLKEHQLERSNYVKRVIATATLIRTL